MIISNVKFRRSSGVVEIDYHEDGKDKTLAMTPMQIVLAFKAQKAAQQSVKPTGCTCPVYGIGRGVRVDAADCPIHGDVASG